MCVCVYMCLCVHVRALVRVAVYMFVCVNEIMTTPTTRPTTVRAVRSHVGRVVGAFPGGGPIAAVLVLVRAAG